MSARSFGSLFMVASCAGAALGCYLVSLRVASERSALESVETRIVLAQRDLRMLQTEIGTRGRLTQLERWNAGAFALSAPAANQFLEGSFELARLARPDHQVDFTAPVVLASAPAPEPEKAPLGEAQPDESGAASAVSPSALLHEASLKTETREVPARTAVELPRTAGMKSADKPVTAAKPAHSRAADRPGLAAAQSTPTEPKKSVDKPALGNARPVTRKVEIAKTDPLAPLPRKHAAQPKESPPGR
jgi:hypothetical protein